MCGFVTGLVTSLQLIIPVSVSNCFAWRMASEDFTLYMVCTKQSFLLIDSSSGISTTIFTDFRCHQLLYVYIRIYIGLMMRISRLRLSTPVDVSVPAYSQVL